MRNGPSGATGQCDPIDIWVVSKFKPLQRLQLIKQNPVSKALLLPAARARSEGRSQEDARHGRHVKDTTCITSNQPSLSSEQIAERFQ